TGVASTLASAVRIRVGGLSFSVGDYPCFGVIRKFGFVAPRGWCGGGASGVCVFGPKTVAKKSPPHEVLLIHGVVPRFFNRKRLYPSAMNATKKRATASSLEGSAIRAFIDITPSAARVESLTSPQQKGYQPISVSFSSGQFENSKEFSMADASPRTDTSTDVDTDDKDKRLEQGQHAVVAASDSSDRSKDKTLDQKINELRSAVNAHASENDLRVIVDGVMAHYDEIFRLKGIAAKADVFHILSGMWKTPAERCFLWLGGFRSSELLKLLANQLEPLTEQQMMGICNLQQSSQQAEDALSQGMEALQQSLAETLAGSLAPAGSSGNVANYMGQMAMAMGKLGTLENFLRQVNYLRCSGDAPSCRWFRAILQGICVFLGVAGILGPSRFRPAYLCRTRDLSEIWSRRRSIVSDARGERLIAQLERRQDVVLSFAGNSQELTFQDLPPVDLIWSCEQHASYGFRRHRYAVQLRHDLLPNGLQFVVPGGFSSGERGPAEEGPTGILRQPLQMVGRHCAHDLCNPSDPCRDHHFAPAPTGVQGKACSVPVSTDLIPDVVEYEQEPLSSQFLHQSLLQHVQDGEIGFLLGCSFYHRIGEPDDKHPHLEIEMIGHPGVVVDYLRASVVFPRPPKPTMGRTGKTRLKPKQEEKTRNTCQVRSPASTLRRRARKLNGIVGNVFEVPKPITHLICFS
ncbi:hypothetical protein BHM03_00041144, partial [Ensete ventricosum]